MIPYGHQSIDKSDIEAVTKVLKSDWLSQGPKIAEFEEALAKYCGAKYAVIFSSGTAALHAAYFAAGLKSGDEFITTPLTFAATANPGLYLGAKPVFADIAEDLNLDPKEAVKKINSKTRIISVVDFAGLPAKLEEFKKIAREHNLVLVEDGCHALGASYKGKKIGSVADMTAFSFHPVKSITTGEGGAVLTDNKDYYEKMKVFRHHGIVRDPEKFKMKSHGDWYHEMQELGYNYRITDIQAALGISQLKRLDKFIKARKKIAAAYNKAFKKFSDKLELPSDNKDFSSSWHIYVIRLKGALVKKRSGIFKKLREAGIGVQVHYLPVYWHPYYQSLGFKKGLCPKAEAYYEAAISLPIFPDLKSKDQKFIVKKLIEIIKTF
ncbi:MAG: UDP-4-amino-4,6-dideoxy-N-acetyl-beta-L-altrosamine transaminase [Candidatus Harrisonbacteria bacterium]|nr:UDP-4-amino-4,6-dideoxy-N-acetyl-beta-L-altrosamine transaminase [Candidatus Harrisonbacteria bacterium]